MPRINSCCSFQYREFSKRNHLLKNIIKFLRFFHWWTWCSSCFHRGLQSLELLCENCLKAFLQNIHAGEQNTLFLKTKNQGYHFASSTSFYVHHFRHRYGFSLYLSPPLTHLHVLVCTHSFLFLLFSHFLFLLLIFGLLVLGPCFRFFSGLGPATYDVTHTGQW